MPFRKNVPPAEPASHPDGQQASVPIRFGAQPYAVCERCGHFEQVPTDTCTACWC